MKTESDNEEIEEEHEEDADEYYGGWTDHCSEEEHRAKELDLLSMRTL